MAQWRSRDIQLVTWTVNSIAEKHHFDSVLRLPYMTDSVSRDKDAAEQFWYDYYYLSILSQSLSLYASTPLR